MNKIKNVHFVGIKGVGMTPLAVIASEAGLNVSGCDIDGEFITDEPLKKAGIKPMVGFDEQHVVNSDLVITTGAHGGFENPEVIEARKLNIPVLTQGEAIAKFQLGEIINRKLEGISVSGTHGKTTTTAMIAVILKANNFDPSFVVGTGMIPFLESDGHLGKGKYFVAEADEYANEPKFDKTPKMQLHKPLIGVITNIEFDHPDVYDSLTDVQEAFVKFAENIDIKGKLIISAENINTKPVIEKFRDKTLTYGFSKAADYYLERVSVEGDKTFFWVFNKEANLGQFSINVSGEHNALNALASIIVCLELGLSIEMIKKGLLQFKGTKRRMEFIKNSKFGAMVFDDYAHHPTEIKKTLETIKKIYPNKKIVCIFQPHTYSRTKSLFEQFISSFNNVDDLILLKIYSSERERPDMSVSSEVLAQKISLIKNNVEYMENFEDVIKYLDQKAFDRNYVIVTMGAGDVFKLLERIK